MKRLLLSIKSFLIFFSILIIQLSCWNSSNAKDIIYEKKLTFSTGLDVLRNNDCYLLKGKRVGLITNQTGVDANLKQNIEIFIESRGIFLNSI